MPEQATLDFRFVTWYKISALSGNDSLAAVPNHAIPGDFLRERS
jgi:hypothetical protein